MFYFMNSQVYTARKHNLVPRFSVIFRNSKSELQLYIGGKTLDFSTYSRNHRQGSVGQDESSWDGPRPSSSSGRVRTRTTNFEF